MHIPQTSALAVPGSCDHLDLDKLWVGREVACLPGVNSPGCGWGEKKDLKDAWELDVGHLDYESQAVPRLDWTITREEV